MKLSFYVIMLSIFFAGCKKENNINECYNRELQTISFGFETSLDDWLSMGGGGDRKFDSDIQISSDTYNEGAASVKFTVSQDSYVNGGVRSELTFDQQLKTGDVTIYEYSFFVPQNYQDVNTIEGNDGVPNWQVLGQWHDQPDECLGEDWNNFDSKSPPIAIYYNYLTKSDPAYLRKLSDSKYISAYGMDTSWTQVSTISLTYGDKLIAIHEIEKGTWYRLKFNIKWSESADGYIQVWLDNNNFTNGKVYGWNMHNKASHYFKFGIYRNPNITFTNYIYFDDIKIY